MKKLATAYGLWAAGVLSAVAAAWLLYRSRVLSGTIEEELGADELLD